MPEQDLWPGPVSAIRPATACATLMPRPNRRRSGGMADAAGLNPAAERRGGSSPSSGTSSAAAEDAPALRLLPAWARLLDADDRLGHPSHGSRGRSRRPADDERNPLVDRADHLDLGVGDLGRRLRSQQV